MTIYTTNPNIKKNPIKAWEEAPFVWNGDLYRAGFKRGWSATVGTSIEIEKYHPDLGVFAKVAELPYPRYLGCIHVAADGRVYSFGSTDVSQTANRVMMQEIDPLTWTWIGTEAQIYQAPAGRKVYNTSVTHGPDGYIMALETDEGAKPFSIRFLCSDNLTQWFPIGQLCHAAFYSACPTIRYAEDGWYLLSYMWQFKQPNGQIIFESAMARTRNFVTIETFQGNTNLTAHQNLMSPDPMEGVNNSDVDFIEWDGKVYFTYLTGDQTTWAFANDAWFDGTMTDLYRMYWPPA